jgi:hypothetical protein
MVRQAILLLVAVMVRAGGCVSVKVWLTMHVPSATEFTFTVKLPAHWLVMLLAAIAGTTVGPLIEVQVKL